MTYWSTGEPDAIPADGDEIDAGRTDLVADIAARVHVADAEAPAPLVKLRRKTRKKTRR